MYPYTYTHLRPPPKAKQPFYATSPDWSNITPIPLLESDPSRPDPGPALATIAYSPRYLEAMSYLRAVMALNESSERVLALTEDIIGMNPAHYTVWGFRMRSLRGLWGMGEYQAKKGEAGDDTDMDEEDKEMAIREGVEKELEWLEAISERNLKNYQIW
jgi:protein farnesyltransferase/geranylgeranyltransferase type-1 subunit alpha